MKKLPILIAGLLFAVGAASADVIFLGVFSGNDDADYVEQIINTSSIYNGPTVDITKYAKVDEPSTHDGGLTITYSADLKSGTWTTQAPIDFYTVKGSDEFALYWLTQAATSGTWTTEKLTAGRKANIPAISHYSAYQDQYNSIPEPAVVSLLGLGILLVAVGRRKLR